MSDNPFKSPFIYLLNAMENASQERDPFKAGYAKRREEVLRYVSELEEKVKAATAAPEDWATCSYCGEQRRVQPQSSRT